MSMQWRGPGVVALAMALLAPAARAGGDATCAPADLAAVDTWLAQHPFRTGPATPESRVDAACKATSQDRQTTIVALAFDAGANVDKNLVVALVDSTSRAIRSAFQGTIQEDATLHVARGSLHLDTARYDLAPGRRAFGLDLSSAYGKGCVTGGQGAQRALFLQEGQALRLVLDGLTMSSWHFVSGTPECMRARPGADGDPVVEHADMTPAVAPHATQGLADLVVTESIMRDSGKAKRTRHVLQFDGSTYPSLSGNRTIQPGPAAASAK